MFFKKILISFFVIFSCLMLFIFIIRLANNKEGFLGLSDLLDYFETIDFYKPLNHFKNDIGGIINSFNSSITRVQNNVSFWDSFLAVFNVIVQGFKLLSIPVVLVFDLAKMLWGYIEIFSNFINFIISFEGWTPPVS